MRKIKVAAIQYRPASMDIKENIAHATTLIEEAAKLGAQLIVLPELFVTGYYMERMKRDAREAFAATSEAFCALTARLALGIVAGVPCEEDGKIYNSAAYYENGRMLARYDKINLFAIDKFSEADYFAPGKKAVVVDTSWGRLGMAVCADLRFPELFIEMALEGAEVVAVTAAFPFPRDTQWTTLSRAEAALCQSFLIACNRAGTDGKRVFCGRSQITGPDGIPLAHSETDKEEIIYAELDLAKVAREREHIPAINARKNNMPNV